MASKLNGKKIAILATDGFEQAELIEPREALEAAGAKTEVIAPRDGEIKGWNMREWGENVKVDKTLETARVEDYDALVLPGGVMNPDRLRMDPLAVDFVRKFAESWKTVAAICHGPWTLIEAGVVKGKNLTSWPSLKTDIDNAGGHWVDEQVCIDGSFITSRKPDDIPAFSRAIIEAVSGGSTQRAAT
jgi:protease I